MDTRRRRRGRFLLFSLFSFTRNTLSRFSFRKIDPRCRLLPDLERSKGPRKSVERRGEKEKRKTLLFEEVKERVTIIKYRGEWLDLVGNKVRQQWKLRIRSVKSDHRIQRDTTRATRSPLAFVTNMFPAIYQITRDFLQYHDLGETSLRKFSIFTFHIFFHNLKFEQRRIHFLRFSIFPTFSQT